MNLTWTEHMELTIVKVHIDVQECNVGEGIPCEVDGIVTVELYSCFGPMVLTFSLLFLNGSTVAIPSTSHGAPPPSILYSWTSMYALTTVSPVPNIHQALNLLFPYHPGGGGGWHLCHSTTLILTPPTLTKLSPPMSIQPPFSRNSYSVTSSTQTLTPPP